MGVFFHCVSVSLVCVRERRDLGRIFRPRIVSREIPGGSVCERNDPGEYLGLLLYLGGF